jgi:hypothetical protein
VGNRTIKYAATPTNYGLEFLDKLVVFLHLNLLFDTLEGLDYKAAHHSQFAYCYGALQLHCQIKRYPFRHLDFSQYLQYQKVNPLLLLIRKARQIDVFSCYQPSFHNNDYCLACFNRNQILYYFLDLRYQNNAALSSLSLSFAEIDSF